MLDGKGNFLTNTGVILAVVGLCMIGIGAKYDNRTQTTTYRRGGDSSNIIDAEFTVLED